MDPAEDCVLSVQPLHTQKHKNTVHSPIN
jgi:hypothetical protein